MVMGRSARLTQAEAARAVYVDFEGTAVDAPSLLGMAWADGDELRFLQLVFEEELWPAARAKSEERGGSCRPATWTDVSWLRQLSESQDRRVVAWSNHELDELSGRAAPEDRDWFAANVVNAIPIAKRWKRQAHPDVVFTVDPKRVGRGRNRLELYLDLAGYDVPAHLRSGNSAQRIRYVRQMLEGKDGQYETLTATAKSKWTKVLEHNRHDCIGLRELMISISAS
jgi:hypothetical protein